MVFVAVFLMHAPLLRLPFFWDEAGFYVPAAYDLVHSHSVIATTTLDTGHPPLSAAYLALWFTLSGWKPAVARVAMLLLAAFALTNVFLLARRLAGTGVAVATTVATAVYPIFFVQSSLTHADLTAAAFTLWGIRLYIERRVVAQPVCFLPGCPEQGNRNHHADGFCALGNSARERPGRAKQASSRRAGAGSGCAAAGLAGLPPSRNRKILWQRRFLPVQRDAGAQPAAFCAGADAESLASFRDHEHAGADRGNGGGNVFSAGYGSIDSPASARALPFRCNCNLG